MGRYRPLIDTFLTIKCLTERSVKIDMKRMIIMVSVLFTLVGGVIFMNHIFKHGFNAQHAEVHVEEHSEDFTDSQTLGFGDKGHVEVVELSTNHLDDDGTSTKNKKL